MQEPDQRAQNSAIVTGQALAATPGANGAGNYVAGAPYRDFEAVAALQTPPTPSTSTIAPLPAALPPSPNVSEGPPAKRQRVGNMAHTLLVELDASTTLERQILQSGVESHGNDDLERQRYGLLRTACQDGDVFFIVLHQLFCCWSFDRPFVHDLGTRCRADPSNIDNAFRLIDTILKSNTKLTMLHAGFFKEFPASLGVLSNKSPLYRQNIVQVFNFLTAMSLRYEAVLDTHLKLAYPFLMDELLNTFGLFSPILQTIMFRASRRNLAVTDGPIGQAIEYLFQQDQKAHRDVNGNTVVRTTNDIYNDPRNASLIQNYRSLVHQQHTALLQQRPQVASQAQYMGNQQPQMRHSNNNFPATGHAYGGPGNPQTTMSAPNMQSPAMCSFGSNFAAPPTTTGQQFTVPSSHHSRTTSNGSVNSPTNGIFFGQSNNNGYPNVTAPQQSPVMSQGQYLQMMNSPGAQFSASPQSSPHLASSFLSSVQPRRTSHQFQVPSSHSPQLQNLVGLPRQIRGSPVQNNVSSVQQAQVPAQSSPRLMPSASQAAVPMQQPVPTAPYLTQIHANRRLTNGSMNMQAYQQTPPQQQSTLAQYASAYMDPTHQSSVRPEPQAFTISRTPPTTTTVDFRRTRPPRIPQDQHPQTPYGRHSLEASLHQAHLRSPRRIFRGFGLASPPERYYQYIKHLALEPTPVPQQKSLHILRFTISESEFGKISGDSSPNGIASPANYYFDGSLRVRLRIVPVKGMDKPFSEENWVAAETFWPEHCHIQLNGKPLMFRRKQHHSKDQPVEVGSFVQVGENVLKVSVPFQKPFELHDKAVPFIAVEVIETLSDSSLHRLPNLISEAVIPAEQTRKVIQTRLSGTSDPDDEVAMVSRDLMIDVTDPFSMTLWNTPVRGKSCTHLECFDLATWLVTRPSKKSCFCGAKKAADCEFCPKEPSLADKWKCPLCQGDARPSSLRIDGFFKEVREALASQDLLRAKKIHVTTDGSWTPVIPDDDDDDTDSDQDVIQRRRVPVKPSMSTPPVDRSTQRIRAAPVEIICLDD